MASSVRKRRPMILVAATVALAHFVAALADDARNIRLRMFMHNIYGPPGQRVVLITKGTGPMNPSMPPEHFFGETYAFDDVLTGNRSESSARRAPPCWRLCAGRPVYVVDMVMLLTGGDYNGSTIVVEGRHDASKHERELAIVGGTGDSTPPSPATTASPSPRCR